MAGWRFSGFGFQSSQSVPLRTPECTGHPKHPLAGLVTHYEQSKSESGLGTGGGPARQAAAPIRRPVFDKRRAACVSGGCLCGLRGPYWYPTNPCACTRQDIKRTKIFHRIGIGNCTQMEGRVDFGGLKSSVPIYFCISRRMDSWVTNTSPNKQIRKLKQTENPSIIRRFAKS